MAPIEPFKLALGSDHELRIRCAVPDDATAVLESARATIREVPEQNVTELDEFRYTEDEERELLQKYVDEPGWLFLVAVVDQKIVGQLNFRNGNRRRIAHGGSFGISITHPWRGQGIGTRLIRTLLDWARSGELIRRIELGALSTNTRAVALYGRLGFVEEGRRRRAFRVGDRYVDDVIMARWV
ncbi:MAG: GNAT family N-acetyltransferase [Planctomycetota bacterium]